MRDDGQILHQMAALVHGGLLALHVLAISYNARRRNRLDVAVHTAAITYECLAVAKHLQAARG